MALVGSRVEDMNEHLLFLRIWFQGHILNVDKKDADYLAGVEK